MTVHSDVLVLTRTMSRNYEALQRFLADTPLPKDKPRKARGCKNAKELTAKKKRLEAQDFRCADCRTQFHPDKHGKYPKATRDHIIPHRYGSCFDYNSEYVCQRCHSKRTADPLPYIIKYFGTIHETSKAPSKRNSRFASVWNFVANLRP